MTNTLYKTSKYTIPFENVVATESTLHLGLHIYLQGGQIITLKNTQEETKFLGEYEKWLQTSEECVPFTKIESIEATKCPEI